jgi:hypothetical protein
VGGIGNKGKNHFGGKIKTVNLKQDLPTLNEALFRLEREITIARQEGNALLKIVHGYGSSGAGGDIRIAVQARLREMADAGQIRNCIFGEDWSKSDESTWRLLRAVPELKQDRDLGRANRGITVIILSDR